MTPRAPSCDRKLTDLLNERFTLSVEIVPPRNGASPQQIFSQIERYASSGADFMSVTKGAGGSLRGGSLPIAQMIKDQFQLPCLAHFTCRDLLPEEVENQLVDHHFLGIRNILALRGDPPVGAESSSFLHARPGSHLYAYQLVEQIVNLNHGNYLSRPGFNSQTCEEMKFCIGVACYPDEPDFERRIDHFKQKVDAGAEFAVTQMLVGSESYENFLNECERARIKIPILPGTCLFKSQEQAGKLASRFGLQASGESLSRLPKTNEEAQSHPELVVENFVRTVDLYRKIGAPGLHAFLIGSENQLTCQALNLAHKKIPSQRRDRRTA